MDQQQIKLMHLLQQNQQQQQQLQQQQAQRIEELEEQNQQQEQQLQQYQEQGNAPPVEQQEVEPPAPPPQLPSTSSEMQNACREGDIGKIVSLIEDGGESPNSVDVNGSTPVMKAIMWGKWSAVKVLFGFGADLSISTNYGQTLLHIAVAEGNDFISWVLDNSTISIDSTDNQGCPAIIDAMESGCLDAVKLLFERGASLSIVNNDGQNLLHLAVMNDDIEPIRWVLDNGTIDVNSADNGGDTPIVLALNNLDAGKLLVEKGGNLFKKDNDGESAMHQAMGPELHLHAKNLVWDSVKPLLLLSNTCSTNVTPVDPCIAISSPLISVLGNSHLVRECIAPFFKRTDIIIEDPIVTARRREEAKKREAQEAWARSSSSSSSSSSSNKKARKE